MMKLSHRSLLFVSATMWAVIGALLLSRGINLLVDAVNAKGFGTPLLNLLNSVIYDRDASVVILLALALYIGYMKTKYVLTKAIARSLNRLSALADPAPLISFFGGRYLLLIALMMSLGMLMSFLGINPDVRGLICTAVGSALLNGAVIYLKKALAIQKKQA